MASNLQPPASSLNWVLITGCSTGIGRALVPALRARGYGVVATARRPETLENLPPGEDLRILPLDVTDPATITAAVAACQDLRLIGLVNNAGYGQVGPLELIRPDELRAQFETNVIGLHATTQAFLPLIRAKARKGEGRIVHIASVLGRLSIPLAGAYNASKHAVIALGETLRLEVGHEISVTLVEPGAIRTEFRRTAVEAWGNLPERARGTRFERILVRYQEARERLGDKWAMDPEVCARKIARALARPRPPRRVVIGKDAAWSMIGHGLLPAGLWEWMLRRAYRVF